jgi:hypothetical protein
LSWCIDGVGNNRDVAASNIDVVKDGHR